MYSAGETKLVKPERRSFSRTERLTIRAEVLPDDPDWHIGRMPALIHTMPVPATWKGRPDPQGGAADGILVDSQPPHGPGLEDPRDARDRDPSAGPQAVNHCVFRGYMKDAVVYWTPGSTGHAMRNCLFHGMYGSTVWTAGIASDFDYRNNVALGANYVWIHQSGASAPVRCRGSPGAAAPGRCNGGATGTQALQGLDSLFANNNKVAGTGNGARIEFADIDSSFLDKAGTKISAQAGALEQTRRSAASCIPVAGSEPARIGAGLFMKPRGDGT